MRRVDTDCSKSVDCLAFTVAIETFKDKIVNRYPLSLYPLLNLYNIKILHHSYIIVLCVLKILEKVTLSRIIYR